MASGYSTGAGGLVTDDEGMSLWLRKHGERTSGYLYRSLSTTDGPIRATVLVVRRPSGHDDPILLIEIKERPRNWTRLMAYRCFKRACLDGRVRL